MNFEPGDFNAEDAERAEWGRVTERTEADTEVTETEARPNPNLLWEDFRGFPSAPFAASASNPTRVRRLQENERRSDGAPVRAWQRDEQARLLHQKSPPDISWRRFLWATTSMSRNT